MFDAANLLKSGIEFAGMVDPARLIRSYLAPQVLEQLPRGELFVSQEVLQASFRKSVEKGGRTVTHFRCRPSEIEIGIAGAFSFGPLNVSKVTASVAVEEAEIRNGRQEVVVRLLKADVDSDGLFSWLALRLLEAFASSLVTDQVAAQIAEQFNDQQFAVRLDPADGKRIIIDLSSHPWVRTVLAASGLPFGSQLLHITGCRHVEGGVFLQTIGGQGQC